MAADTTVLGYLGRALSLELSAVQQYLSLARLLEMRSMKESADQFRHESQEELRHAELIIGRMLALGVAPNASQLRPARLDGSMPQLLEHVANMENEIVDFYAGAVRYCTKVNDGENRLFFDALLREEQEHSAAIQNWHQQTT